jgi:hypothetical protein
MSLLTMLAPSGITRAECCNYLIDQGVVTPSGINTIRQEYSAAGLAPPGLRGQPAQPVTIGEAAKFILGASAWSASQAVTVCQELWDLKNGDALFGDELMLALYPPDDVDRQYGLAESVAIRPPGFTRHAKPGALIMCAGSFQIFGDMPSREDERISRQLVVGGRALYDLRIKLGWRPDQPGTRVPEELRP